MVSLRKKIGLIKLISARHFFSPRSLFGRVRIIIVTTRGSNGPRVLRRCSAEYIGFHFYSTGVCRGCLKGDGWGGCVGRTHFGATKHANVAGGVHTHKHTPHHHYYTHGEQDSIWVEVFLRCAAGGYGK